MAKSVRPHPNLTHFPSANRPTTLQGYSCYQCRTNVTHIGPIRKYFENANFCHHVTSDKILVKFEILPICLKLVGNLDLVSSYRSGIITSGFGSKKYPFAEFLAFSCHFTMNKLTHEFQATPQFNTFPIGQSSYNFTGLLLPSVLNKCHQHWTDSRIF